MKNMKTVYYKEYAETLAHWQYLSVMMAVSLKCFRGIVRTPPHMLGGLVAAELNEYYKLLYKMQMVIQKEVSY